MFSADSNGNKTNLKLARIRKYIIRIRFKRIINIK